MPSRYQRDDHDPPSCLVRSIVAVQRRYPVEDDLIQRHSDLYRQTAKRIRRLMPAIEALAEIFQEKRALYGPDLMEILKPFDIQRDDAPTIEDDLMGNDSTGDTKRLLHEWYEEMRRY